MGDHQWEEEGSTYQTLETCLAKVESVVVNEGSMTVRANHFTGRTQVAPFFVPHIPSSLR